MTIVIMFIVFQYLLGALWLSLIYREEYAREYDAHAAHLRWIRSDELIRLVKLGDWH